MPGVTIGVSYSSNHEEDIAKLHTRMPYCCKLFEIWYEILQLSLYGMKKTKLFCFVFFSLGKQVMYGCYSDVPTETPL